MSYANQLLSMTPGAIYQYTTTMAGATTNIYSPLYWQQLQGASMQVAPVADAKDSDEVAWLKRRVREIEWR